MPYGDWTVNVANNITASPDEHTLIGDAGGNNWNTRGIDSVENFSDKAYISWKGLPDAGSAGGFMLGLSETQDHSGDYTIPDFLFECSAGGVLNIYELGVNSVGGLSFVPGVDKLSIYFSGSAVIYSVGVVEQRTVSRSVGAPLYLVGTFYGAGDEADSVLFANDAPVIATSRSNLSLLGVG